MGWQPGVEQVLRKIYWCLGAPRTVSGHKAPTNGLGIGWRTAPVGRGRRWLFESQSQYVRCDGLLVSHQLGTHSRRQKPWFKFPFQPKQSGNLNSCSSCGCLTLSQALVGCLWLYLTFCTIVLRCSCGKKWWLKINSERSLFLFCL